MSWIRRCLLLFAVLIAVYMVFAFSASLLPDSKVNGNIAKTLNKGDLQTDYPNLFFQKKQCQTDNFTDALILIQAWNFQYHNVWHNMLMPTYTKCDISMCDNLRHLVEGERCEKDFPYPRYWHGSTFLMRFLLFITDYTILRLLFFVVSSLMLVWALIRLRKTAGWAFSILFLLSFILLYGYIMQFSIQFLPVLILSLSGVILACDNRRDFCDFALILFAIGSLTAFFDLLTAPLLTFGLPICSWFAARRAMVAQQSWSQLPKQMVSGGLAWLSAYALTWSFKWVIASLGTSVNVFQDAVSQAGLRFNDMEQYNRWDAITINFAMIPSYYILLAAAVLVVMSVWKFNRKGLKPMLLFLLIALLPYIWFFVVANHSYLHWWFTYRLQMFSVLALFYAIASLVDWPSVGVNFFKKIRVTKKPQKITK